MAEKNADNRSHKRYRVKDGMVQYKPIHFLGLFSKPSKKHLIMDILLDGMQFITRQEFRKQAVLALEISAPLLDRDIIHVKGRVAWVRKAPGLEAYGIGVKFDPMEPAEQNRLKALIDSNNPDKAKMSDSVHLKKINKV